MLNNAVAVFSAPVPPVTNAYESIATSTVGSGGASSITFSSIPSTYKHLQLRVMARTTNAGDGGCENRFNGSSAQYMQYHQIYGDGSSAAASAGATSASNMEWLFMPGTNRATGIFGTYVIDILDYASADKNKVVRNLGGFDANGAGYSIFRSHLWNSSTTPITSISFTMNSGNFAQYSSFALYGIKG